MKCSNCGIELENGGKYCLNCGAELTNENKYCSNCGAEMINGEKYCSNCGAEVKINGCSEFAEKNTKKIKFLPSFIIGLIGSIFGIFGGMCMTMCAAFYSSSAEALIFILGGSVVGMVGACTCLKDTKKGSILELIGAVMIIICAFGITGAEFQTILALILLLISGIMGLLYAIYKSR